MPRLRPRLSARPGPLGAGLLLLALWVQALAPIAALRMEAAAVDPLAIGVICGHARDTADAGSTLERQTPPPARCDLCRLCCAGILTPTLPGAPAIARELRWFAVSWPIPPPPGSGSAARYVGQPRAPPAHA